MTDRQRGVAVPSNGNGWQQRRPGLAICGFLQLMVKESDMICNRDGFAAIYTLHRYVPQRCIAPVGPARRQADEAPATPGRGFFQLLIWRCPGGSAKPAKLIALRSLPRHEFTAMSNPGFMVQRHFQ
jgi:hypothetical protein